MLIEEIVRCAQIIRACQRSNQPALVGLYTSLRDGLYLENEARRETRCDTRCDTSSRLGEWTAHDSRAWVETPPNACGFDCGEIA